MLRTGSDDSGAVVEIIGIGMPPYVGELGSSVVSGEVMFNCSVCFLGRDTSLEREDCGVSYVESDSPSPDAMELEAEAEGEDGGEGPSTSTPISSTTAGAGVVKALTEGFSSLFSFSSLSSESSPLCCTRGL